MVQPGTKLYYASILIMVLYYLYYGSMFTKLGNQEAKQIDQVQIYGSIVYHVFLSKFGCVSSTIPRINHPKPFSISLEMVYRNHPQLECIYFRVYSINPILQSY